MKREYIEPPTLVRVLRYGHSGEDVKAVQTILQEQGYFQGTPLGNFKTLTRGAVKYFQGTHIGADGEPLLPDGVVGEKTWWALHNPSGTAQRRHIETPGDVPLAVSGTSASNRLALVRFMYALHATGVREIPNGSNYGDGVTAIVNACGFRYGIAWCLAQASHGFKESQGTAPLGAMHVGCSLFWNEAVKAGVAHPKKGYTPCPGDIAIYNYGNGLRRDGTLSGPGHATTVVRVAHDGKSHNAIEGNVGNRCAHSIRKHNEGTLIGFVNLFDNGRDAPRGAFPQGTTPQPVITLSLKDSR